MILLKRLWSSIGVILKSLCREVLVLENKKIGKQNKKSSCLLCISHVVALEFIPTYKSLLFCSRCRIRLKLLDFIEITNLVVKFTGNICS